jgi:hypothetical protein
MSRRLDEDLAEVIKTKIYVGRLPSVAPGGLYAGAGDLAHCDGCGEVIQRYETAYHLIDDREMYRLHAACFVVWERAIDHLD